MAQNSHYCITLTKLKIQQEYFKIYKNFYKFNRTKPNLFYNSPLFFLIYEQHISENLFYQTCRNKDDEFVYEIGEQWKIVRKLLFTVF